MVRGLAASGPSDWFDQVDFVLDHDVGGGDHDHCDD